MFLVVLTYVRPLEEVDALIPEHVRFLEQHYASGLFVLSGRRVPRTGGVILVASEDPVLVEQVLKADPFAVHGVATYDVTAFTPTKMQPGMEPFIFPGAGK